MSGTETVCR